jgi:small subunit ribosomal protein S8
MSDPISDMITRIRNGQRAQKSSISTPASKMRGAILDVLQKEGFIRGYTKDESVAGKPAFEVELKYSEGKPVIVEIHRISRPGRRVYSGVEDIPRTYSGLGISIISTSRGVLSDIEARKQNVGGEILCRVF